MTGVGVHPTASQLECLAITTLALAGCWKNCGLQVQQYEINRTTSACDCRSWQASWHCGLLGTGSISVVHAELRTDCSNYVQKSFPKHGRASVGVCTLQAGTGRFAHDARPDAQGIHRLPRIMDPGTAIQSRSASV